MKVTIELDSVDEVNQFMTLWGQAHGTPVQSDDFSILNPEGGPISSQQLEDRAAALSDKVQIIPNAYKWYKETHGEKLTAKAVGERAAEENYTPTGKGGKFSLDDIKALFPEPDVKPNGSDAKPDTTLSIDDVREVTEKLVNARSDGKQLAAGLVRDTYKVAKLSDLPQDVWPEYIKKAAAYISG